MGFLDRGRGAEYDNEDDSRHFFDGLFKARLGEEIDSVKSVNIYDRWY